MPEVRAEKGKPREGSITLGAVHEDGQIKIVIKDDGGGLNTDRIRQKAIERGLINEHSQLNDDHIHQLIFEPGFSTAEKVSDVSGRGVGMDVVKTSIESLQGTIHISSHAGQGTQINIYLPLTLAIIDGLMVKVGDEHFILPLSAVEECVESPREYHRQGPRLIKHRGERISAARLREAFSITGEGPAIEQTIVTRIADERFGITVDEVVGQHQTVIKNLGKMYRQVRGLLGATILGNGNVALILDVADFYEQCKYQLAQSTLGANVNVKPH
ncbi:chemotaxis protein CheA [Pseudobowmanella zhangzhouensis]